MNVLVTGGSGFIGSHLVDLLLKDNHSVYVIDNLSTGKKINNNSLAFYYYYDLKKSISNQKKIKDFIINKKIEIVYHLAANASVNASMSKPLNMMNENFNSSIALVEACKNTKVKKFVFASTAAVYGDPSYLPVDESHKVNPISVYGLSKLLFEEYLKYFNKQRKISIIILRLPNVYGPRQRADLEGGVVAIFNNLIKKNKRVTIFGNGKQKRDWVYVLDIAEAFKSTLSYNSKFDIIAIGSNVGMTVNKLFELISNKYQYKKKPNMMSSKPGDIKNMIMGYEYAAKKIKWKPKINLSRGIELIN